MNFSAREKIINSDQAFDLKKLPKKILILGGGYIAVEFASIFSGLGVNTTICVRGDRLLKGFDSEISAAITKQMELKGVKIITNNIPKDIYFEKNLFKAVFQSKPNKKFDMVMEAVGRIPNTDKLNLELLKMKTENGAIKVDKYFETSVENVYAIGDVIDRIQLTPVAIAEAMIFVENLKLKKKKSFNYTNIPTAVFCDPNYSFVGFSEEQAKSKYKNVKVYKSSFRPLKYTLSKIKENVLIKLIVNKDTDKVLGLHYVGENAAEIVQGFSVAIANGLKKAHFDKTIGIHPTSAEEIVTLK